MRRASSLVSKYAGPVDAGRNLFELEDLGAKDLKGPVRAWSPPNGTQACAIFARR